MLPLLPILILYCYEKPTEQPSSCVIQVGRSREFQMCIRDRGEYGGGLVKVRSSVGKTKYNLI